jgi:hypothetical protein
MNLTNMMLGIQPKETTVYKSETLPKFMHEARNKGIYKGPEEVRINEILAFNFSEHIVI